jgi:hypothetical protein
MLNLSEDVMCGEYDECIVEVLSRDQKVRLGAAVWRAARGGRNWLYTYSQIMGPWRKLEKRFEEHPCHCTNSLLPRTMPQGTLLDNVKLWWISQGHSPFLIG